MKINPNDPWYPGKPFGHSHTGVLGYDTPGVPIRLKLVAEMMKSPYLPAFCPEPSDTILAWPNLLKGAFYAADAMIKWANCDEGKEPE